jgi:hypothetical protein
MLIQVAPAPPGVCAVVNGSTDCAEPSLASPRMAAKAIAPIMINFFKMSLSFCRFQAAMFLIGLRTETAAHGHSRAPIPPPNASRQPGAEEKVRKRCQDSFLEVSGLNGKEKVSEKKRRKEKVSGLNGTVEECKVTVERAEILLTRDRFFEILIVVW